MLAAVMHFSTGLYTIYDPYFIFYLFQNDDWKIQSAAVQRKKTHDNFKEAAKHPYQIL